MPEETKNAYFQMILPKQWTRQKIKPVCLQLAGTGDHVITKTCLSYDIFKILNQCFLKI